MGTTTFGFCNFYTFKNSINTNIFVSFCFKFVSVSLIPGPHCVHLEHYSSRMPESGALCGVLVVSVAYLKVL